ncbi:hypothetical protein CJF42_07490 [Pseudoalteromonas sp. NBT06-2]|uniref:GGDEF domain-containing protein n=1 Tax=Pseudoalteromonas sp. NBT06-2 TaxID=2025950 RepID=UPI000BA4F08D|nr:GGDEF domain-containing protein [Pseudoalteromonas sp. NBT06-2]PAJ75044.1 hypothetical protein CJF42_07490 [Pseudoalteromonas sp. NBT06-2]
MTKFFRWTIAKKFGGTVFILLVIILSLLVHSVIALTKIEAELKEISTIDVPLTKHANEIEIAQVEQRILMDELIRKKLLTHEDTKKEETEIIRWSEEIDKQFEIAINISQIAVNTVSSNEFHHILMTLTTLKEKHDSIYLLLKQLIDGDNTEKHLDMIIQQDEAFDRLAIALIHAIEELTQRKAKVTVKHEELFAMISYSLGGVGAIIGIVLAVLIIMSIKASISKITRNINLVSSAIASNKDIPIDQVEQVQSSDEFGELSHDLTHLISQVSSDIDKRERVSKQLNELATKDHLTKCYNRFKWDESRELEVTRALNTKVPLALIFFDIDHFKKVNDNFGHDVGDTTLIDVARIAQQSIRQFDTLYRTGGEEFSVLLPNTELPNAEQLAERIRKSIASYQFETVGKVTVSLGVTIFKGVADNGSTFAKRADSALYQAKDAGRNQVSVIT